MTGFNSLVLKSNTFELSSLWGVLYYGRNPVLEQMREDCALGKEGVSSLGISKATEKRACTRLVAILH